ncbi:MAG: hypothetical protein IJK39_01600 [Bacteroidales bacterium]|nr:hypothetical protein [Bacteroidales bacterium]
MKKLIYIFLILLGFTSCMKDDKVTKEPEATDKVEIIFGVDLPETMTKVMADDPQVQNLRVAVFGGSGFLKEYVQADPIGYATENTTKYNYKVRLSLSDSYLKVHFIANGPATLPFKYEDEVMSVQTVSGNQDAYWQKIELPNGITAKKDEDGVYIKVNGEYVVSDETKAHFQDIPMVRNFAKIVVTSETTDFILKSYAIVNKPTAGSIAPYNKKTNAFVMNYQDSTMAQLKSWYPGNIPAAVSLDKSIPAASAFSANPIYMYERPIPTEDATFLIVFGTYSDGEDYYYRIELQDADGYYAIYRNWVYTVKIKGILRPGSATPTDAANSSGSGDVSTDQKAENLTDVSDGIARIFVQYTDTTIVGNGVNVTLKYMFLPDATSTTTANGEVSGGVGVEIAKHQVGATGAVIAGDITRAGSDDSQHWRTLSFTTTNAGEVTKTESIKITGHYMNGSVPSKLFRIVTFHLMSLQTMQVVCDPHDLLKGKGEKVDVLIKLPKDLPRSLFPLQLKIESSANSITPDNDNLPVTPGKSIINGTTATYQFIKTLDYDDYLALQEASTDEWVTVTTHFKTTKESSDCDVYVANQYFNTAHDSFITYEMQYFDKLKFDKYNQSAADMPVKFSFEFDSYIPEKVTLKLVGLKPVEGSTLVQVATNTYEYTPTGSTSVEIDLLTSTDDGYYKVDISAPHYYDASHDNLLQYVDPGFTGTSVPFGIGQSVPFSFSYANNTTIEPVTFNLTNLVPQTSDTRFERVSDGVYTFTPNNNNVAQSITFVTTKAWSDVAVTSMSGDSYSSAGPFTLPKATSLTVPASAIYTSAYGPTYETVTVYTATGVNVGSYYCTGSGLNQESFTLDLSNFGSDNRVYFSYTWQGTYYSPAYTIEQLAAATSSSRLEIPSSGWTTTRPW